MAKVPKAIADMSTLTRVIFDLDTTPPSLPSNVIGTPISSTRIDLAWTASVDTGGSGMAGYLVFRNGVQIGTPSVPSYSDTGLTASTSYQYQIEAVDGAGNASSKTTAIAVSTQANVGVPAYAQDQPKAALVGIAGVRTFTDPTQQAFLGRFNWMVLGIAGWEGWASGGRDADVAVKAIKTASTAPGTSLVFAYSKSNVVEEDANDPFPTFTAEVVARNWKLFSNVTTGVVNPNDGAATAAVNYTDAVPVNPSLEHPYEYAAAYLYNKFLTKSKSDGRFISLAAGLASSSFDGVYWDNLLCNPQIIGDWSRDGTPDTTGWPCTATTAMQQGQARGMARMRSLAPTKYIVGNCGDYGVVTSAGAMAGQVDSPLAESYMGKYWSWETQKGFVTMLTYYYRELAFAINPELVVFGGSWPDTDSSGGALPRLPAASGYPPAYTQEQWARYIAGTAYLGEGMSAISQVSVGYNSDLSALYWPWFYGGVNGLARSWMGKPVTALRPAAATIAKGTIGLYHVERAQGLHVVNPRGNGAQTVTKADIGGGNWQYPAGSPQGTGVFSSYSLAENDALFLQRYTPVPTFTALQHFNMESYAVGATPNVSGGLTGDGQFYARFGNTYGSVVDTTQHRPSKTRSLALSIQKGTSGFPADGETPAGNGMWGFLLEPPTAQGSYGVQGDWVHFGMWMYVPSTAQLRTTSLEAGALKFTRTAFPSTTASKSDCHICEQPNGFALLSEFDPNNTANNNYPDNRAGTQVGFPRDQWFWYEHGQLLQSNGDSAIVRVWINDTLQLERNGRVIKWRTTDGVYHTTTLANVGMPTLPSAATKFEKYYIFTYWNAHPAVDTKIWTDDISTANESRQTFSATDNLGNKIMGSTNFP